MVRSTPRLRPHTIVTLEARAAHPRGRAVTWRRRRISLAEALDTRRAGQHRARASWRTASFPPALTRGGLAQAVAALGVASAHSRRRRRAGRALRSGRSRPRRNFPHRRSARRTSPPALGCARGAGQGVDRGRPPAGWTSATTAPAALVPTAVACSGCTTRRRLARPGHLRIESPPRGGTRDRAAHPAAATLTRLRDEGSGLGRVCFVPGVG